MRRIVFWLVLVVFAGAAGALVSLYRGGFSARREPSAMGTVAAVEETRIVVKAREGETLSVLITKETKFRDGKSLARSSGDLRAGDRVMIELRGSGANATAKEIRFSSGSR